MHRLCSSKSIWVHFLQNLDVGETPNLPPHVSLSDLNGLAVRQVVLDAKQRKCAWTSDDWDVRLHHVELFSVPTEDPWRTRRINPRMLPDCKHVLLDYRGALELWSVERKERLWIAPAEDQLHDCVTFDFDCVDGGDKVVFAAWFGRDGGLLYIRVFEYDLREDKGRIVLQRDFHADYIWKLVIRSRLLMVHMPNNSQVFLIDLSNESTTIVDYSGLEVSNLLRHKECEG